MTVEGIYKVVNEAKRETLLDMIKKEEYSNVLNITEEEMNDLIEKKGADVVFGEVYEYLYMKDFKRIMKKYFERSESDD